MRSQVGPGQNANALIVAIRDGQEAKTQIAEDPVSSLKQEAYKNYLFNQSINENSGIAHALLQNQKLTSTEAASCTLIGEVLQ